MIDRRRWMRNPQFGRRNLVWAPMLDHNWPMFEVLFNTVGDSENPRETFMLASKDSRPATSYTCGIS
uniref:Uncharacterized protein n=1 Tax=Peronospora matthiolae TaxID=2874970 RepID=A0AAV1TPW8_9STRA